MPRQRNEEVIKIHIFHSLPMYRMQRLHFVIRILASCRWHVWTKHTFVTISMHYILTGLECDGLMELLNWDTASAVRAVSELPVPVVVRTVCGGMQSAETATLIIDVIGLRTVKKFHCYMTIFVLLLTN
jgi:hypothetical protein